MTRDNGFYALFAIFLMFCDRTNANAECVQLSPCSCILQDGQGYDLTSLTHLGVLTAVSSDNSTFYFHPCKNYKFPNSTENATTECFSGDGVSLCMYDFKSKQNVSLGTTEETTMEIREKNPFLIFEHKERRTEIELLYCETCETRLVISTPLENNKYHLQLMTPSAAKVLIHTKGLSVGSILVILLFVFSGLYFIGGAIALKLLRGATGWEMLPNHKFWCELPSLVREGIVFTFNCCHTDSYQSI